MTALLPVSVGIGLAVSLLLTEALGLATGGMIVPGYFALFVRAPQQLANTLMAALITFGIVRGLSAVLIIYGRRRTTITLLCGFLVGMMLRSLPRYGVALVPVWDTIGFILPGLIAIWFERQGVIQTLCSLTVATCIVRLLLILTVGAELGP